MLHYFQPQQIDGSLGKGYNHYMSILPSDDDWAVLMDYDAMFLYHPEEMIQKAIKEYPDTELFTCFTNRIGNKQQLFAGKLNGNADILNHQRIAYQLRNLKMWESTPITIPISGFCMILKKSLWKKFPFPEEKGLLGVDNEFSSRVLKGGKTIRRINGLYMFHFYRLNKGAKDTSHLK